MSEKGRDTMSNVAWPLRLTHEGIAGDLDGHDWPRPEPALSEHLVGRLAVSSSERKKLDDSPWRATIMFSATDRIARKGNGSVDFLRSALADRFPVILNADDYFGVVYKEMRYSDESRALVRDLAAELAVTLYLADAMLIKADIDNIGRRDGGRPVTSA